MSIDTSKTTIPVSSSHQSAPRSVRTVRRLSTETKAAFKTTEFWIFIAMSVAVLIASATVGSDSNATSPSGNSGDYFRADKAWLLITILSVGYMFSRGLAKAGSRDFYDAESDDNRE